MDSIVSAAKLISLKQFNQKKLSELQLNHTYPILAMRKIETKFGTSIVCDLQQDGDDSCSVFLPKRYAAIYKDKQDVFTTLTPLALGLTITKEIPLPNRTTTYALDIDYCEKVDVNEDEELHIKKKMRTDDNC